MGHILEFDSINLEFGFRKILSSVAMKCERGEVVGLLGRNGSGKSCLMKIVFGAMRCQHKSVRIDDRWLSASETLFKIGYLPQEQLLPQNVKIGEALKYLSVDKRRVLDIAPFAEDWLNLIPSACSGGSLRFLECLMILLSEKQFCFLDEPFSGIAPLHIEKIKELINVEKKRKGILVSDHLYKHVLEIANRSYALVNGQTYPFKNKHELIKYGYLHEIN